MDYSRAMGTEVQDVRDLEHEGKPARAVEGPAATGVGWDLSFLGLGLHLGSGGGNVDREASDAWLASDRGKAFLHACAESWGRAHVAAGEAPQVARAMAARTASFFSGD